MKYSVLYLVLVMLSCVPGSLREGNSENTSENQQNDRPKFYYEFKFSESISGQSAYDFTCFYDNTIDSVVSSSNECDEIEGLTFDDSTGTISWIPSVEQNGGYEFFIVAINVEGYYHDNLVSYNIGLNQAPDIDIPENALAVAASQINPSAGFLISDPDSTLDCTTSVSMTSSNSNVLAPGDVSFTGTAPNCTMNFSHSGNQLGRSILIFTVTDEGGLTDSQVLEFRIVSAHGGIVSTGDLHACFLNEQDGLHCWGKNQKGAIGDSTQIDRAIPSANSAPSLGSWLAGEEFVDMTLTNFYTYQDNDGASTCALTNKGRIWCSGVNTFGVLGIDSSTPMIYTPQLVDTTNFERPDEKFSFLAKGTQSMHQCAISNYNVMYCWGRNAEGQLGNQTKTNSSSPFPVNTDNLNSSEYFTKAFVGAISTCAFTNENRTFCWGSSVFGQIGQPASSENIIPKLLPNSPYNMVFSTGTMGNGFACWVNINNQVLCYGAGDYGQRGDGAIDSYMQTPTLVDQTGLSSGEFFVELSAGHRHMCGITSLDRVFCWGSDEHEQIGNGIVTNAVNWMPVLIDDTNLPAGYIPTSITAGIQNSCLAITDGDPTYQVAYCWGSEVDDSTFNWILGEGVGINVYDRPTLNVD